MRYEIYRRGALIAVVNGRDAAEAVTRLIGTLVVWITPEGRKYLHSIGERI